MFATRITQMLGIKHPLQCGTMMFLSNPEFVAAAANAGVLACLASAMYADEASLAEAIAQARGLTDQPFGVNLSLFPGHAPVPAERVLEITAEAGVKLVETAGRSPEPLRPRIQEAGLMHLHKCARVRDALKAQKLGVDLVAVVGAECGGHPSPENVSTLVLAPQVTAALEVPVIVGGGFCDGRGLVAALALGADAVLMGTRFMNTVECPAHPAVKERLIAAQSNQTMVVQRGIGSGIRVLDNHWARRVQELEEGGAGLEELMPYISGKRTGQAWQSGDPDALVVCGQVVGSSQSTPTIAELVEQIMAEAEAVRARLA
ncbi:MAG: nitronate monooxygenase [Desulfarculaceae bacterium]|nr:nitronate monooxygenase [Desulfarculaceae bacterium]